MRAHQQHGLRPLQPGRDRIPLFAASGHRDRPRRRARSVRTGRDGRRGERPDGVRDHAESRGPSIVGRSRVEHVVAGIAGHDDASARNPERARDPGSDQLGRGREERRSRARPPVAARHHRADQPMIRQERHPQRGRGVQVQLLQRDAVPQLHGEASAGRVAVDVAEAVGDDQHARAQRRPPAAHRMLRLRIEACARAAASSASVEASHTSRSVVAEPVPRRAIQREGAFAEPDPGSEDPSTPRARHEEGGDRAQPVEGQAQEFAGVAGTEGEGGHVSHDSGTSRAAIEIRLLE